MKKVIGIDLGGTVINGGIINEKGKILKRISKDTGVEGGREIVLGKIKEIIRELIQGNKVEGIGIGSPGFIDTKKGSVLSIGGNIEGWANTKIKEELSKEFGDLHIFVENDANVAAVCEEWLGAAKGFDSFIMLTLGTGVGGAIYSKKEGIWHGDNCQGAEFGHAILYPNGKQCKCGQKGCVEQYISGTAVEKTYMDLMSIQLKGKDIFAKSKIDEGCKKVVDLFIKDLGSFLISIKNIFDTEGVVIGGGIINSQEYWWNEVVEYYEENCNGKGMKILPAEFLNNAGMIGAAKIVFDKIEI